MSRSKDKVKKFGTNTLYWYANKYTQNVTETEEIEKIDMTNIFLNEIDYMIEEGELINITINGRVRTGKSTLSFKIGEIIWDGLKKYGYRDKKEKFGMRNICRDQQEYNKKMRNPETAFTVLCTDEKNTLETTGENSTVERAMEQTMSDVHAGRYVHRVSCSPKDTLDDNSDIILTITGIDKDTCTTHAKLYYRYAEGGMENIQLLGYIRISVYDIIKNWIKIKKKYYKPHRTKADEKEIEEWKKKDYYIEYVIKKHEKMELITQEGILRPRILDYAEMILAIVKKLKGLTKINRVVDANMIRNTVKAVAREQKIPMSIIGEQLATQEVQGILKLYENYHQLNKRIYITEAKAKEIKTKFNDGKILQDEYKRLTEDIDIKIKQLKEIQSALIQTANDQEEELEKYQEINKQYQTIEND